MVTHILPAALLSLVLPFRFLLLVPPTLSSSSPALSSPTHLGYELFPPRFYPGFSLKAVLLFTASKLVLGRGPFTGPFQASSHFAAGVKAGVKAVSTVNSR
jgi:hypothetical protein